MKIDEELLKELPKNGLNSEAILKPFSKQFFITRGLPKARARKKRRRRGTYKNHARGRRRELGLDRLLMRL